MIEERELDLSEDIESLTRFVLHSEELADAWGYEWRKDLGNICEVMGVAPGSKRVRVGRLDTKKGVRLWTEEEKRLRQPERIRQAAPTRLGLW